MGKPRKSRLTAYRRIVAMATLVFACSIGAAPSTAAERYTGEAKDRNGVLLYRESHWLYQEGESSARLVLYTCPDGKAFARKRLWDRASAQAPDFEFDDARDGFSEGVRSQDGARRVFLRAGTDVPERSAVFTAGSDTVIDAGFDTFVRTHWDALAEATALPIAFLVPSRLAPLEFSVRRVGDERIDGRNARRFRLALARWYGGLLPHIDVVYDALTHTLLRYEGIGNIRGTDARNLDVRIDFPAGARVKGVGIADITAAAATALNGTCRLP